MGPLCKVEGEIGDDKFHGEGHHDSSMDKGFSSILTLKGMLTCDRTIALFGVQ